jgi:hypothetical protein
MKQVKCVWMLNFLHGFNEISGRNVGFKMLTSKPNEDIFYTKNIGLLPDKYCKLIVRRTRWSQRKAVRGNISSYSEMKRSRYEEYFALMKRKQQEHLRNYKS